MKTTLPRSPSLPDNLLDALADALAERMLARMERIQPQTADDGSKLYGIEDLMARYKISRDTVGRLVRSGAFGDTVNVCPSIHLVTEAGVAAFEAARTGPAHPRRCAP